MILWQPCETFKLFMQINVAKDRKNVTVNVYNNMLLLYP